MNEIKVEIKTTLLQKSISQVFIEAVNRNPDKIGLTINSLSLTYLDLHKKSNQLANYLRSTSDIYTGDVIGILSDPSEWSILSMLAILKLGAVYLPLDTRYPKSRLQYMIEDAGVSILLSQKHLSDIISNDASGTILFLEEIADKIHLYPDSFEVRNTTGNDLAYIMYTSGTTGKPNGVEIPQIGILRLVLDTNYFDFKEKHTFLQLAPIGFDASTFEIWGALLNGHKLVLYPDRIPDFILMKEIIDAHQISVLWLTASLFNLIVDEFPQMLTNVQYILTGGEALSVKHIKKAQLLLPDSQLINGYGPTESTTFACCYSIPDIKDKEINSISIGKPISNTDAYILDKLLQPIAPGEMGELYIGGKGLATGYRNNPELTQKKFVKVCMPEGHYERLYKTGDICRFLPDGNIEYIQRADHQVKIRGFRIELSEIEAAILKHEAIASCLAIVKDHQIYVYITGNSKKNKENKCEVQYTIGIEPLKILLREWLPEYMMPHQIIELSYFPVTPNGKVDRANLPNGNKPERKESGEKNPQQSFLVKIWEDILTIQDPGADCSFFDLGGTSLHATQMIFRVNKTLGVNISLTTFYRNPTIGNIMELIREYKEESDSKILQSQYTPNEKIPLTPGQKGLWFLNEFYGENAVYNIPMSLTLHGHVDVNALSLALNRMTERHSILRTSYHCENGVPYQKINEYKENQLEVTDVSMLSGLDLANILKSEASTPFHLNQDSVIRYKLFRISGSHHILFIDIHHIAFDGWSLGLFKKELSLIYNGLLEGYEVELPELSFHYADYANWVANKHQDYSKEIDYWKQKIGSNHFGTELPTDYPRPINQTYHGDYKDTTLDSSTLKQLKIFSKKQGVSLYVVLTACFKTLLYHVTGDSNISIASPNFNRNLHEFENVIGFFVNSMILSTDLSGEFTYNQVVERVSNTIKEAFEHQDIPFVKLVEKLVPHRDSSRTPLHQIIFVLQNADEQEILMNGLRPTFEMLSSGTSKCDLTFIAEESDEKLLIRCEYNTDLFKPESICRFLSRFIETIHQCLSNPDQPIIAKGSQPSTHPAKPEARINDIRIQPRSSNLHNSQIEERLRKIWKEILEIDHIDVNDNFFEIGGYSLLAIRLIHRINQEFSVQLSIKSIFEFPTISSLEKVLLNKQSVTSPQGVVQIRKGKGDPLFLFPGIIGNAFTFQPFAEKLNTKQPLYVLEYPENPEELLPEQSMAELAAYFIRLIRLVQATGPYHLAGYSLGGRVVFEMAMQLQKSGEKTGFLGIIDTEGLKPIFNDNTLLDRIYNEAELFIRLTLRQKFKYLKHRAPFLMNEHQIFLDESIHHQNPLEKKLWFIWNNYKPKGKFAGDLYFFNTESNVHPIKHRLHYLVKAFPDMYWRYNINGKIHIESFKCEHADFLKEPYVDEVVKPIARYFNQKPVIDQSSLAERISNLLANKRCARSKHVDIFFFDSKKLKSEYGHFEGILQEEEVKKAKRFKPDEDRINFVIRHGVLRTILAEYLSTKPADLVFYENEFGKSVIADHQNHLHLDFSISSSHGYSIIAIGKELKVGIDLESIDHKFDFMELACKYLHSDEVDYLRNTPDEKQRSTFFEIWTAKEAFLKANKILELDKFPVPNFDFTTDGEYNGWYFRKIQLPDPIKSTLVISEPNISVSLHHHME